MSEFERFSRLWTRLGAKGDPRQVFDELEDSYSESHRYYHTMDHVTHCINELERIAADPESLADEEEVRAFLQNNPLNILEFVRGVVDEAEFSLYGHDKEYRISRSRKIKDNELRSATWAKQTALNAQLSVYFANNVYGNIMDTEHDGTPKRLAAKLTVDADLMILGKPREVFILYEENIRKEWHFVPQELFNTTRAGVLEKFLKKAEKSHLYTTKRFRTLYEEQAKENLAWSIRHLRA